MANKDIRNHVLKGRKILCAGVNYRKFAISSGQGIPNEPVVFLKPTTSYIFQGDKIQIPKGADEVSYEVELGIVIGKGGKDIPQSEALNHVAGYCAALDMTDMPVLRMLREKGLPFAKAKGFDTACPVGDFIPANQLKDPQNVNVWLKLNGVTKQHSNTNDMIFPVPYLISWMSNYFTLEPGDLILTGTPEGMGPAKPGDVIECGLGDITKVKFQVMDRSKL